jgi:hypothetical protein
MLVVLDEAANVCRWKNLPDLYSHYGSRGNTGDVDAPAEEATPASDAVAGPTLFFGSVDEFVRERLRYTYSRRVGPQGPNRWAAEWWRYPEAISRLDALWRSWEALRLEPTFGMSVWWRDHADHDSGQPTCEPSPWRPRTSSPRPLIVILCRR